MSRAAPDLATEFAGLALRSPVFTASGTFGYGEEFRDRMDLGRLGGIVVKSLTLEPRGGNPPRRIVETASGMLNSIGLQNVGVDAFIRDKLPFLRTLPVPIVANVAGTTMDDYEEVCRRLVAAGGIAAVELNISCPNVKRGGMEFGVDCPLAEELTRRVRKVVSLPLIVKLSPNVTDIAAVARAVEAGGANAVSVVNTFLGMAISATARAPRLATTFGGLSGPAIKPLALRCVWQVAEAVRIPVMGLGGITSGEDAAEFLLAGAAAVAVGTATFAEPTAALRITEELRDWLAAHGDIAARNLIGAARRRNGGRGGVGGLVEALP